MTTVTSIKANTEDSREWTPVESFQDLIEEIQEEESIVPNKSITCILDDRIGEDGVPRYNHGFRLAGMTSSEAIALLEIIKTDLTLYLLGID